MDFRESYQPSTDSLNGVKATLAKFQDELGYLKEKLKCRNEEIQELKLRESKHLWTIESLEKSIEAKNEEIENLKVQASQVPNAPIHVSEDGSGDMKNQILKSCSATMQVIQEYELKMKLMQSKIDSANDMTAAHDLVIKEMEEALKEKETEVMSERDNVRSKDAELRQFKDTFQKQRNEYEMLASKLNKTKNFQQSYEKQIQDLRTTIQEQASKLNNASSQMYESKREVHKLQEELSQQQERNNFYETQKQSLREEHQRQLQEYIVEIDELRGNHGTFQSEMHSRTANYEMKITDLNETICRMKDKEEDVEYLRSQLNDEQQRFHQKTSELESDLLIKDALITELNKRAALFENEKMKMACAAENEARKTTNYKQNVEKLRSRLNDTMSKLREHEVTILSKDKSLSKISERNVTLMMKLEAHESLNEGFQEDLERLNEEAQKERKKLEQYIEEQEHQRFKLNETHEVAISELKQRITILENSISCLENTALEKETIINEYKLQEECYTRDMDKSEEEMKHIKRANEKAQTMIQKLTQACQALKNENKKLSRNSRAEAEKLKEYSSKVASYERETSNWQNKELQQTARMQQLEKENHNLGLSSSTKVSALENDLMICKSLVESEGEKFKTKKTELETEIRNLEEIITENQLCIKDHEMKHEETLQQRMKDEHTMQDLEKKIHEKEVKEMELVNNVNDLQRTLKIAFHKHKKFEEEKTSFCDQTENLKAKLKKHKDENIQLESSIRNCNRIKDKQVEEISKLKSHLAQHEDLLTTLKDTHRATTAEHIKTILEQRNKCSYLEEKIEIIMEEVAESQSRLESSNQNTASALEQKEEEIRRNLRLIADQRANAADTQGDLTKSKKIIQDLNEKNTTAQKELAQKEHELHKYESKTLKNEETIANLKRKHKEVFSKNTETEAKFMKANREIAKLRDIGSKTKEYLANQERQYANMKSQCQSISNELQAKILKQGEALKKNNEDSMQMMQSYEEKLREYAIENDSLKNVVDGNGQKITDLKSCLHQQAESFQQVKKNLDEKEKLVKLQNDLIEKRGSEIKLLLQRQQMMNQN